MHVPFPEVHIECQQSKITSSMIHGEKKNCTTTALLPKIMANPKSESTAFFVVHVYIYMI